MLVPRFALSQTHKEVVVMIKLPYVRVGDAELSVVRGVEWIDGWMDSCDCVCFFVG